MPALMTHRYDPVVGSCRNVCSLPYDQALRVIDQLRRCLRPRLKPDYLEARLTTEDWLIRDAGKALDRDLNHRPVYFFLGDFSWFADPSRPATLLIALEDVEPDSMTFTLGDSMTIARKPDRRVYTLEEMIRSFIDAAPLAGFGFCDTGGPQAQFVEVQVWDKSAVIHASTI